jgi:hypothetical protein
VETGRLPAADKDKYAKYEPGRLIAVIDNSAPMQMGARREQEAAVEKPGPSDPHRLGEATEHMITDVLARSGIKRGA